MMRVNVYNEDLLYTEEGKFPTVSLLTKVANGQTFKGVQIRVGKPYEHGPKDDDSHAVIFWFNEEEGPEILRKIFKKVREVLGESATQS